MTKTSQSVHNYETPRRTNLPTSKASLSLVKAHRVISAVEQAVLRDSLMTAMALVVYNRIQFVSLSLCSGGQLIEPPSLS